MMRLVQKVNGHYPDFTPGAHSNNGNAHVPKHPKSSRKLAKVILAEDREYLNPHSVFLPGPVYQE